MMIAGANSKIIKCCFNLKTSIILLLVAVILLGVFLRLYKLGYNDIWFDEAISASSADNIKEVYSLSGEDAPYGNLASEQWKPQLIYYKSLDPQPFFYYFLLKHTIAYLGNSAFSLRLLSVFFSILSMLTVYKLGAEISNKKNGIYAACLISISPLHIWYAQEARQYSLAVFLVTLSAYFLILALEKKDNKFWVGFVVSATLLIYTNYIGFIFLFGCLLLSIIKKYKVSTRKLLLANIVIIVFFLPWNHIFRQHIMFVKEVFWIAKPSFFSLIVTLKNFNTGYNSPQSFFIPSLILFSALAFLGFFYLKPRAKAFLLMLLFLPILLIFIISQRMPIYIDRQLILFSPFYYIIIANGISGIRSNLIRWLIVCLILVFTIPSLCNYFSNYMQEEACIYHQGAYVKKPFQPAVNYIENNWQKGDTLIYSHVSVKPSFHYYQKYGNLKQDDQNKYEYKRIWLVSSSWSRDCNLSPKVQLLRERLGRCYKKADTAEFDGIFIDLYAAKGKDL